MHQLDTYLLNRFQKFCDRMQSLCGVTCFTLTKIVVLLAMMGIFFSPIILVGFQPEFIMLGLICFAMFHFVCILINKVEKRVADKPDYMNTNVLRLSHTRPVSVVMYVIVFTPGIVKDIVLCIHHSSPIELRFALTDLAARISIFCIPVIYYLLSCTPKPPSKNKFKEWKEKWQEKIQTALLPKPKLA